MWIRKQAIHIKRFFYFSKWHNVSKQVCTLLLRFTKRQYQNSALRKEAARTYPCATPTLSPRREKRFPGSSKALQNGGCTLSLQYETGWRLTPTPGWGPVQRPVVQGVMAEEADKMGVVRMIVVFAKESNLEPASSMECSACPENKKTKHLPWWHLVNLCGLVAENFRSFDTYNQNT